MNNIKDNDIMTVGRYCTCITQTLRECRKLKSNSHAQKILRCVFILRCANQPVSKFKLRSHGFYRQEYFCR